MANRVSLLLVSTAIAISFSQLYAQATQQQSTTRSQEMCELKALEAVGYRPSQEDFYYPRNLQAAQARLEAKNKAMGLPPGGLCSGDLRSSDGRGQ